MAILVMVVSAQQKALMRHKRGATRPYPGTNKAFSSDNEDILGSYDDTPKVQCMALLAWMPSAALSHREPLASPQIIAVNDSHQEIQYLPRGFLHV